MGLSIRQATADDLPAAVRLFEIRDGHAYEPELIFHKVGWFDPKPHPRLDGIRRLSTGGHDDDAAPRAQRRWREASRGLLG